MKFTNIVLAYFVIGTVMVGGGAVDFQEAGVSQFFVQQDGGSFTPEQGDESPNAQLDQAGGAITQVIDTFIGGIQLVYNLAVAMLGYLNWPIVVLSGVNAPPMAVLLIGGTFTASFYLSVVRLFQSSA